MLKPHQLLTIVQFFVKNGSLNNPPVAMHRRRDLPQTAYFYHHFFITRFIIICALSFAAKPILISLAAF